MSEDREAVTAVLGNFQVGDEENLKHQEIQISPIGNGLIHDTYLVNLKYNTKNSAFILQRINNQVFPNVSKLMENIDKISRHLQSKRKHGSSLASNSLVLLETKEDKTFWEEKSSETYWRIYHCIPNSISFSVSNTESHLYEAGKAYGQFHRDLADFPAESLNEILVGFHCTPKRLEDFRSAVRIDPCHRVQTVESEIQYIESHADISDIISGMLSDGTLPTRVTHNDTKLDNVLFHTETERALCVVDYDTIMPNGSLLYDFGDSIRSIANTAHEDEEDLEKVDFNLISFKRFTEGFLGGLETTITAKEKQMLPKGALVITFEQAIRFLTDYLTGDTYFKIAFPRHNLNRARNQLRLFEKMLEHEKEMMDVVQAISV